MKVVTSQLSIRHVLEVFLLTRSYGGRLGMTICTHLSDKCPSLLVFQFVYPEHGGITSALSEDSFEEKMRSSMPSGGYIGNIHWVNDSFYCYC